MYKEIRYKCLSRSLYYFEITLKIISMEHSQWKTAMRLSKQDLQKTT